MIKPITAITKITVISVADVPWTTLVFRSVVLDVHENVRDQRSLCETKIMRIISMKDEMITQICTS